MSWNFKWNIFFDDPRKLLGKLKKTKLELSIALVHGHNGLKLIIKKPRKTFFRG